MKKKIIFLLVLAGFGTVKLFAQAIGAVGNADLVSFPSPQATEMARYVQVPVDYYNGLASVSIPLFELPVKGIPVNIGLQYHSGGIKPNAKGSWTGLGWTLKATGIITRIQNGQLDENVNPDISPPYNKTGYYWNQSTLNRSDWETPAGMLHFLNRVVCQGFYGKGNPSTDPNNPGCGDIPVSSSLTDWAPDEFTFSFLNYSGSFWLDHTGKWMARESSGENLKVELINNVGAYSYTYPTFPGSPIAPATKSIPYTIKGFVITDGYGNKFIFGNDPNSIELNRSQNGGSVLKATASSWYLKQITTYLNETISFEYERKYPTISLNTSLSSYYATVGANSSGITNLQSLSGVVIDPVYLKTIRYNDYEVLITYSESPLAQYEARVESEGKIKSGYNLDGQYYPIDDGITPVKPTEFKIDKIQLNNGNYSKQYTFLYYDVSVANRLFLKSITEGNILRSPLIYEFEYNGTIFDQARDPQKMFYEGYQTTKVDHWGFYNNKIPIETSLLPIDTKGFYQLSSTSYVSQALLNAYVDNRNPNAKAMLIGSLKKITYPTGGYTEFFYEPNSYSKKISLTGTDAVAAGGDFMVGGLRVSEIRSLADVASIPLTKKYFYVNSDGSSSGVLNSKGIIYEDMRTGTVIIDGSNQPFKYKFFYDNSQYPLLNTNGNHVTYSRIEEVVENGSKKIYEFSNHDDKRFTDMLPYAGITTTDNAVFYVKTSSRQFARGKLLKEQNLLANTNTSIRTEETTFENDNTIVDNKEGIRTYSLKTKDVIITNFHKSGLLGKPEIFRQANIWEPNITSNLYYIHQYRPVQKTVTEIENGITIKRNETYEYDAANYKIKCYTVTNHSNGENKSVKYYYPIDFSGIGVYDNMVSSVRNMINPIVKIENYVGTELVSTSKTNYGIFNGNKLIQPSSKEFSLYAAIPEADVTFNAYDAQGNVTEAVPKNGVMMSYVWGYNLSRPIGKVINAGQSDVAATSFEPNSKGNWDYDDAVVDPFFPNAFTGKNIYNLSPTAAISTAIGLSKLKTYIVSYWSTDGFFNVSFTAPLKKGKTINGWTYFEHEVAHPMDPITINGTGKIDELRVYPKGAQMSTYTYHPLAGITSECDLNNRVTYYEYDGLGRLGTVRDQDCNILRKICYNYAGKQIDCLGNSTAANWQTVAGSSGCEPCATNNSFNAGNLRHQEKDVNSLSKTFNQTRWVNDGVNASCPVEAWQNSAPLRCEQAANGSYTGYQLQEQKDASPCSPSYNNTRLVKTSATNTIACPLSCKYTVGSGFSVPSGSLLNNGTSVTGYLVFYSSNTLNPGSSYLVATINGTCVPSATRTINNFVNNGRTWNITIYSSGEMYWQLVAGAAVPPNTSIAINSLTYNL